MSTLQLVDLAGSESAKATAAAAGERLKEGGFINKSLLALGTVIRRLGEAASPSPGGGAETHRAALFFGMTPQHAHVLPLFK